MTPDRYARIGDLFDQAVLLAPPDRDTFLKEACGEDSSLRAEVEQLLAHDAKLAGEDLFVAPWHVNLTGLVAAWEPAGTLTGRRIGPYEVRECVGTGGMGRVYRAVRVDGFRQEVALKLVRPGVASTELLRRFRTERQVLASLNHPNIARLLDGGTSAEGLPYFVMEFLDGEPLHRYCEGRQLGIRERLELFATVCRAVQHAHEKGVVHRDLKPGNVLVTKDGTPKVTDFGLAKVLHGELAVSAALGQTVSGAVLGTPSYMAPEQAEDGKEVGPAADVYALGAILYELLTGRPPFRGNTPLETLRQVRDDEPLPPSRLHPRLPRNLETICLKCLEKAPHKRYASASALADDVGRFLAGEPICARPVTQAERVWRWCERKPLVAGLLTALIFVGVGGFVAVLSLWLLAEERARALQLEKEFAEGQRELADERGNALKVETEKANRQRDRARQAVDDMYTAVAEKWLADAPHMQEVQREFLRKALAYYQELIQETGDDPEVRHRTAQGYYRMGNLYINFEGDAAKAAEAHRQAIALWKPLAQEYPDNPHYHLALYQSKLRLAAVLRQPEQAGEKSDLLRQALQHAELLVKRFPDEPLYWDLLAAHYHNLGIEEFQREKFQEAEECFNQGVAVAEVLTQKYPNEPFFACNVARNQRLLGLLFQQTGRIAEAEDALRKALEVGQWIDQVAGKKPASGELLAFRLEVASFHRDLGALLKDQGKLSDAEPFLKESLAITANLVEDYPTVLHYRFPYAEAQAQLGQWYHLSGRAKEAEEAYLLYLKLLDGLITDFPGHHADSKGRLAEVLCRCPVERLRDPHRAIALVREVFALGRQDPGNWLQLGHAQYRAGDYGACVPALEKALTCGWTGRAEAGFLLSMVYCRRGDLNLARQHYQRAIEVVGTRVEAGVRAIQDEAEQLLATKLPP